MAGKKTVAKQLRTNRKKNGISLETLIISVHLKINLYENILYTYNHGSAFNV
jgi:hypothetical protein